MNLKLAIILPFTLMFGMSTMVQAAAIAVPRATATPAAQAPAVNKAAPSYESPKASLKRSG